MIYRSYFYSDCVLNQIFSDEKELSFLDRRKNVWHQLKKVSFTKINELITQGVAEVISESEMSSSMKDLAIDTATTAYSLHSSSLFEVCKLIRDTFDAKYG